MATVREGDRPALVVVDAQVGVIGQSAVFDRERVIANVARSVAAARDAGVPVVWVQHADEELVSGSPEWQLVPGLSPTEGEPLVAKSYNSSFEDTDLEQVLEGLGVTHVVLAGAATNWCIRATAYGALSRGYDITLVGDAHTTEDLEFSDGRVIPAGHIIDELNAIMRWVSYPGVTNTTVPAKALSFSRNA